MTLIDKVIAAVTPAESDEARAEARAKARAAATPGGWLSLVLDHHLQIEAAFTAVARAGSASARLTAQKQLASILGAHSIAEEAVIYPAMALADEKGHAKTAYAEQSEAKMEMAALDELDPMSPDYLDKLEEIRQAVAHHVYQEEGSWFPELQQKEPVTLQGKLSERYQEEFRRYAGTPSPREPSLV